MKIVPTKIVRWNWKNSHPPWAVANSDLVASIGEEAHLHEHDVADADDEHGAHDEIDDDDCDLDDADDEHGDDDGNVHLDDGGTHEEVLQRHHGTEPHGTTGLLFFSAMQQMMYLFVRWKRICWNWILVFLITQIHIYLNHNLLLLEIFHPSFDGQKGSFEVPIVPKVNLKNWKNGEMDKTSQFWACFGVFE